MSEFLHMGGYAAYVWPSYGLALFILVYNIVVPLRRKRGLLRSIARRVRREGKAQ
jgi:heme exporter protein D